MAYNAVMMENPNTGENRKAPVGFSWTTFFFGIFVPLFRSDWKWAIIMFLAAGFTCGLSWLVFPFLYNKLYLKDLVGRGFRAAAVLHGSLDGVESRAGMTLPRLEPKPGAPTS